MREPVEALDGTLFINVSLTLDGWERHEVTKRGGLAGNYGFIAMKFGEVDLDDFVKNVVKPAVKNATGCDLVSFLDVRKAGVLDTQLRAKIRAARFVIADLTHDNHGAYWEAGYAERCCMDRGGDGIRPFPSGSVRRYVRTQAVRVRSLCSGLSGRPGSP